MRKALSWYVRQPSMSQPVGAGRSLIAVRVAGATIVGVASAVGGLVLLLGTGPGDPRLFEIWPLLAFTTIGVAAVIAVLLYRRTRRPGSPSRTRSRARDAVHDVALLVTVTLALGGTVVVAWVAVGGVAVFQGPGEMSRTDGLLVIALVALSAAGVGALLAQYRPWPMAFDEVAAIGFAAWIGELLILLVAGRLIADELGRGAGTVVSVWLLATAGVVQPVAFAVGGMVGLHLRPDVVAPPPVVVDQTPDTRFRNGFVVHDHTDVPDFPLVEDFSVEAEWADSLGVHMHWTSASLGPLTWFPWWDHLELDDKLMDRDRPPVGTWEDPFYDADQCWEFYAWDDGEHVYVATGAEPGQIDGAYRVPRETFLTEWRDGVTVIRAMRPASDAVEGSRHA